MDTYATFQRIKGHRILQVIRCKMRICHCLLNGLRPSVAYLQSKGKDLGVWGDQDLVKYVDVGATYYFNKNMSTFVDYKINLLDKNDFTKALGVSTDDIVAVGLVYQF